MDKLKDKVIIITGGTSGIGKGIVEEFIGQGAKVVFNGRDEQKGKALEEELHKGGKEALFIAGSVDDPQVNKLLVNSAIKHFGRLDGLVMSAGFLGIGKITELSLEDWHNTLNVNLSAVFYLAKYGIPEMEASGGGSIVIIGSVAAHHAFPNHPAYCAAKGALLSFCRQVALDYGPTVRINLICPAQVMTPLLEDSTKAFADPEDIIRSIENRLPMKRLGTPQDISSAALYLMGDESGWVTGSSFVIDGGFLAT